MKRFNVVSEGYDVNEVNRFIDIVIRRLEKLNNENNAYSEEINKLNKKIEELSRRPQQNSDTMTLDSLNKAIIAVQDTADRMKLSARNEAEMIVEDAKRNASAIVHEALVKAEKIEIRSDMMKKNINVYKGKMRNILNNQLELIDDMDKDEIV